MFPPLFLSSRKRQSGFLSFSFPPLPLFQGAADWKRRRKSVDQPRTEYELFEKRLSLTVLNEWLTIYSRNGKKWKVLSCKKKEKK